MAAARAYAHAGACIRQRCGMVFAAAERDELTHFALALERLDACADYVIDTMRRNYPDCLQGGIPYHSRWRHFEAGGRDRWAELAAGLRVCGDEIARIRTELAILSALLDAGAGERWRYVEAASGQAYQRSEGLAVASFHLYTRGAFSSRGDGDALRVDGEALAGFGEALLARALQVSAANPLLGVNGRVGLLRRLGGALRDRPECFGAEARLGRLFDYLRARAQGGRLPAGEVLGAVLHALQAVWPPPGDTGRHPAARPDGVVPFHKLSQWLSYSLLEPLQEAGIEVTDLGGLTGLPEYRNGGLFIDLGVLEPKHAAVLNDLHSTRSEVVVEWRALTVILLDRLAERIRAKLGLDEASLPLAKVLQGGTWSAGRRIARERRDGAPPLRLASDGTVF